MSEVKKKYHCLECDKYYKSRSSLSHHRRRYHKKVIPEIYPIIPEIYPIIPEIYPTIPGIYPTVLKL